MEIQQPREIYAEANLLCACLVAQIAPPCRPEDFSVEIHRAIAQVMHEIELAGMAPDLATILMKTSERTDFSPMDISKILDSMASDRNLDLYARIVKDYSVARKIQALAVNFVSDIGKSKSDTFRSLIDSFGAEILKLSDGTIESREVGMLEGMKCFLADLDERMNAQCAIVGLPFGLPTLDRKTCGMSVQDYVVLAARPSMGKTALALQVTRFNAKTGKRVLWFSLDMSKEGLFQRLVAAESGVELGHIRTGQFQGHEYSAVANATKKLSALDVITYDAACTEIDVIRKVRKIKPDLVIVDFLQKVVPSRKSSNRVGDYADVSATIKNILKERNIPGLILCQLSRDNEKESRPPRLSDLRETGAIEQDADIVLFLHAKNKTDPMRTIIVDKQRQGECAFWDVDFDGAHQVFTENENGRSF
jgi:replicative DNA helicase